jgi:hypothetical protein
MSCCRRARSSSAQVARRETCSWFKSGLAKRPTLKLIRLQGGPFLAFELWIAPATWVPVWAFRAPVCFVDAAPDAGQEQDEIQVWEPALIEGLAGFQDGVAARGGFRDGAGALGGFPAWQAQPDGSRDAAVARDEFPVLLLGVAESQAALVLAWLRAGPQADSPLAALPALPQAELASVFPVWFPDGLPDVVGSGFRAGRLRG